MNLLETQELDIGYKRPAHVVATNLNLTLHAGELVCLLGPNGAGKSTLMRTIAGMQSPLGGTVTVQGEDIHQIPPLQRAKTLAIVLTERQTPAMLTGTATIALGRHPHTDFTGRFTEHDEAVVQWAIGAVNGQHLANKYLNTMSDGERQKIMIARALAQEPTLMLLDEPTAFLDLPRRVEMMHLLRQLAHKSPRGILISTHDLELALRNATRLWLMDANGNIRTGAPEDLVLNGAFQHTFNTDGLTFDITSGTFQSKQTSIGNVAVFGDDDVRLQWTQRALKRANITINPQATTQIHISSDHWQVMNDQNTIEVQSLYELLSVLSRQLKQKETDENHSTDSPR